MRATGSVELGPEAWSRPGFWEQYFEGEAAALAAYEEAFAAIMEEA